ncbi:MAG: hypothetical protein FJ148_19385 [Deltaproteobacteria bacterium]|nr:hypothetical protein [Deltaproteobacteria bacterium]
MSTHSTAHMGVDLAVLGVVVDSDPVDAEPSNLVELARSQFGEQGELVPPEGHLLALARVAAGFLRTSPVPGGAAADAQRLVVQSFVHAAFGWWRRDPGEYVRLATLLDDVFRQREIRVPDGGTMEMLLAIAVSLLRRRRVPATATSAQLAVADWLSSLYLAGLEDW